MVSQYRGTHDLVVVIGTDAGLVHERRGLRHRQERRHRRVCPSSDGAHETKWCWERGAAAASARPTGKLRLDQRAVQRDLRGVGLHRARHELLGRPVVALVLLLFAFTTAVAWSYYGDRAVAYLFGTRWLVPYRLTYVVGFFVAAISDTSLIWLIAAITVALMTIPNLIAILLLRVEVKALIGEYWNRMQSSKD